MANAGDRIPGLRPAMLRMFDVAKLLLVGSRFHERKSKFDFKGEETQQTPLRFRAQVARTRRAEAGSHVCWRPYTCRSFPEGPCWLELGQRTFRMPPTRIMMIEDNASDIFLLRRALIAIQGADFDLEVATDGERALQLIGSRDGGQDIPPGVILLDMHLPRHDGLEILVAIRKNPNFANTPVLITTNAVSPDEADELQRMGVDYRLKPRDLAEFGKLAAELVTLCNEPQAVN